MDFPRRDNRDNSWGHAAAEAAEAAEALCLPFGNSRCD